MLKIPSTSPQVVFGVKLSSNKNRYEHISISKQIFASFCIIKNLSPSPLPFLRPPKSEKDKNLHKLYDYHVSITFPDIYCRKCDRGETVTCQTTTLKHKARSQNITFILYIPLSQFLLTFNLTRGLFLCFLVFQFHHRREHKTFFF